MLHVRLPTAHLDVDLLQRGRLSRQLRDCSGVDIDHLDRAVATAVAGGSELRRESNPNTFGNAAQRDSVLGSPRPGQAGLDGTQVKLQKLGELRLRRRVGTE